MAKKKAATKAAPAAEMTLSANEKRQIIQNATTMRSDLLRKLIDGPGRDLNSECGYPDTISVSDYHNMYEREGIAARVVDILPQESWSMPPEVYETEDPENETEFEKVWKALLKKRQVWYYLSRADQLSGVGRFGVVLLGLNDGKQLSEPVESASELLYIRTFEESVVTVGSYEKDTTNERFGQPNTYNVQFDMDKNTSSSVVHWTRIIHLADNRQMSEVLGTPRMQKAYNRLFDIRKILSGSGEMFWKGAFPGYSFEVDAEDGAEIDTASLRTEMENYMNGLQRYLALSGVTAKSLSPQVADPTKHFEAELDAIALTLGIPKRVFLGSEQAQLASSQDIRTWNRRLKKRQDDYLTPMVIEPFIDRLIMVGVLPEPKEYMVEWPDLDTQTDEEKAVVAAKWAEAMAKYVAGGVEAMIAPDEFFSIFAGLTTEQIIQIQKGLEELAKAGMVEGEEGNETQVVPVPAEENQPVEGSE